MLDIPNGREVNHLIGSKGSGINAIQSQSGTHVEIQKAHEVAPGTNFRRITITRGNEQGARHGGSLIGYRVAGVSAGAGTPAAASVAASASIAAAASGAYIRGRDARRNGCRGAVER